MGKLTESISPSTHPDNRTGAEHSDAELKVFRCSYKGVVVSAEPGYHFPRKERPVNALAESPLRVYFFDKGNSRRAQWEN